MTPEEQIDKLTCDIIAMKRTLGVLITWLTAELGAQNAQTLLNMISAKPEEPTP